jgi:hypothetical protein
MSNDGLDRLPAVASADAFPSSQLQVVPPIAVKTGSAGGGKSATPSSLRSIGRAGNHDSVQHESRLMEGQSSVPSIDQSALTGELAGVRAVASAAAGVAGVSAAATTTTSPRETFAALDATDAPATATWIHAGARQAEAGFQDPALGWIGVRADSSGGGVHAQLVPGSADAAQALGGHLEGLNAYLIEHRTPVETLTLTAPESGWAGSGSDKGAGQQMQQGAGQQTGQQTGQGTDSGSQPSQSLDLPVTVSGLPASSRWLDGGTQAVTPGGVHISVMA